MTAKNRAHFRDRSKLLALLANDRVGVQVPNADRAIARPADHHALPPALGTTGGESISIVEVEVVFELEAEDAPAMTGECRQAASGLQTPDLDRPIPGPCDDPRRVEFQAVNASDGRWSARTRT